MLLRNYGLTLGQYGSTYARRSKRRIPKQIYPSRIEESYRRALLEQVQGIRLELDDLFTDLPWLLEQARLERGDSARNDGIGERLKVFLEHMRSRLTDAVRPGREERLAEDVGSRALEHNRRELSRQIEAGTGIALPVPDAGVRTIYELFIRENVALIRNIPAKIASDLEMLIPRAVSQGRLHRDLAKDINKIWDVGERRAKLIARDQVGKLYGQANSQRQKNLGVEEFIIRTVNDRRVRDEHAEEEGKKYTWENAPFIPGEPILCRCSAEPVFDALFE